MHLKLNRGMLVGDTWRDKGQVIPADGKYAEQLVRCGAAVPFAATVETAAAEPRGERAVSPRQSK